MLRKRALTAHEGEGAKDDLAVAADIEHARSEGNRNPEPRQRQRDAAHQNFGDPVDVPSDWDNSADNRRDRVETGDRRSPADEQRRPGGDKQRAWRRATRNRRPNKAASPFMRVRSFVSGHPGADRLVVVVSATAIGPCARAAAEYQDTVGELPDFAQIGGDQQDGDALVAQFQQLALDERDGAHVEAAGRMGGD